jgi:hypothetical protein
MVYVLKRYSEEDLNRIYQMIAEHGKTLELEPFIYSC